MLLCDFAEELNGKLYIMGGGWDRVTKRLPTISMALAVNISVPWNEANRPHEVSARLVTDDGQVVTSGDGALQMEGKIEVGRPAGVKEGSDLKVPLVLRLEGLEIDPGRYTWEFSVDGAPLAKETFSVVSE